MGETYIKRKSSEGRRKTIKKMRKKTQRRRWSRRGRDIN